MHYAQISATTSAKQKRALCETNEVMDMMLIYTLETTSELASMS